MMATLARFTDADIPLPDQPVSTLRAFFEDWHSELTAYPVQTQPVHLIDPAAI
jgi:hypothetical protein